MVLCIAMTGANVYLLHLNRNLSSSSAGTAHSAALPIGKEIRTISGIGFDNAPISIDTSTQKATVLMVYSPVCPYCERNWPNWSSLTKPVQNEKVNFVAVDITGKATPEFLTKKHMARIRSLHRMDPRELVDLNLMETPETILIGADSKVKKTWYGVLSEDNLTELNRMISQL